MPTHAIRILSSLSLALGIMGGLPAALGQTPDLPALTALTLAQAEQLLETRNREVQAARRAVESAQANIVTAGARPNPNLGLGIGAINPSAGVGAGTLRDKTVDSSIRIDQLIERGDKRELRIDAAKKLESASAEDLSDTVRQQRLALKSTYYDLLFAQDKAAIARDTVSLFERSTQAADLRLKAGDVAAADVSRLRVDALRAQNDARVAEADRRRAQIALAYLIGMEAQSGSIRAGDAWPAPLTPDAAEIMDDMIDRMIDTRPDVRAAKSRVEAAQKARDLARSLRTRDVTVGAQYDHYPISGDNALGSGNSYSVFMSVPLFTRYHYEGEIQRAEVDYYAAVEALEKVRALARGELSRARSDLQSAAERLRRYDESLLVEARKATESAEFAYRNGAIGVMDLLDSRRTLRAIQIDTAATARADYAKALAAWQAGLGDTK